MDWWNFEREVAIENALKLRFPDIKDLTVDIEDGILAINFTRDATHTEETILAAYTEILSIIKSV